MMPSQKNKLKDKAEVAVYGSKKLVSNDLSRSSNSDIHKYALFSNSSEHSIHIRHKMIYHCYRFYILSIGR